MVSPILGLLLIGVSLVTITRRTLLATILLLTGITLALAGLVWGCLAIRCPRCHARLLWKAMKGEAHQNWLSELLSLNACPYCEERKHSLLKRS